MTFNVETASIAERFSNAGEATARLLGRDEATVRYELGGVQVHGVRSPSGLVKRVRTTIAEVRPDWVLVPSDDPGSMVLATALGAAPDRVVYLTHTIQQLPFGPSAFYPSAGGTAAGPESPVMNNAVQSPP